MNYESSAKQILNVLGKDNIQSATHCMTRLRFVLKDEAGIDDERVKKIPALWASCAKADSIRSSSAAKWQNALQI